MLVGEYSFPHLREAEEARLVVALERRRIAAERAPRPGRSLRERLAHALAGSKRKVEECCAAVEEATVSSRTA